MFQKLSLCLNIKDCAIFILAFVVGCNLTVSDSDWCLAKTSGWGFSYKCKDMEDYWCKQYEKDMRRCCPQHCDNKQPFTIEECEKSSGNGVCDYPFLAFIEECSIEGMI